MILVLILAMMGGADVVYQHRADPVPIFQGDQMPENKPSKKEYLRAWRQKNLERVSARQKAYDAAHAEHIAEYQKRWRDEHKEHLSEAGKRYQAENRDVIREKSKARYRANPSSAIQRAKIRYESNRDQIREQSKAYYRQNSSAFKQRAGERRAKMGAATVGDPAEIERFYEHVRDSNGIRCYWCKRRVPKHDRHVDHIIPLYRGGAHATANLCASCSHCNLTKRAKMPEDFCGQGELPLA